MKIENKIDYSELIKKVCNEKLTNVILCYTPLHFNQK